MFSAAVHHSYACSSQSVSMGPGIHLDVSQIKMQALEFDGNEFGPGMKILPITQTWILVNFTDGVNSVLQ